MELGFLLKHLTVLLQHSRGTRNVEDDIGNNIQSHLLLGADGRLVSSGTSVLATLPKSWRLVHGVSACFRLGSKDHVLFANTDTQFICVCISQSFVYTKEVKICI